MLCISIAGSLTLPAPDLPLLPHHEGKPVFDAPWQAQAFALAGNLNERGVFAWPQFAAHLSAELARHGAQVDADAYYRCWLAALQELLEDQDVLQSSETAEREGEWHEAAERTPHGQPIRL